MRTRSYVLVIAAMIFGMFCGSLMQPRPASAVSREIVELQEQVSQLLQGQQDMKADLDNNVGTLKTLVNQSVDGVSNLNHTMASLQQSVQQVQANTGNSLDSASQQVEGLSGTLQSMQGALTKLQQQVTDVQSHVQSIEAKVSTPPAAAQPSGAPAGPSSQAAPPQMPPVSSSTLYRNAQRDFTTGNYDLARQEFSDYLKNFPQDDLAPNAQFYLGEIAYDQGNYKDAIAAYDNVLSNYSRSLKSADSLYRKALSELHLGMTATGRRDLRDVAHRYPGTDAAAHAQAELRKVAAPRSARARSAQP